MDGTTPAQKNPPTVFIYLRSRNDELHHPPQFSMTRIDVFLHPGIVDVFFDDHGNAPVRFSKF